MVGEGAGGDGPAINRKCARAATGGPGVGGVGSGHAAVGWAGAVGGVAVVEGAAVEGAAAWGAGLEGAAVGEAASVGGWQPGDQNLSRLVQAAAQQEGQLYYLNLS